MVDKTVEVAVVDNGIIAAGGVITVVVLSAEPAADFAFSETVPDSEAMDADFLWSDDRDTDVAIVNEPRFNQQGSVKDAVVAVLRRQSGKFPHPAANIAVHNAVERVGALPGSKSGCGEGAPVERTVGA